MKNFLKTFGLVLLVMILGIGASFVWVAIYSAFIDPGKDAAYYEAYAMVSAPVISVTVGPVLMYIFAALFSRKMTREAAKKRALQFALMYIVLDLLIMVLAVSSAPAGTMPMEPKMFLFPLASYTLRTAAAFLAAHQFAGRRLPPASLLADNSE